MTSTPQRTEDEASHTGELTVPDTSEERTFEEALAPLLPGLLAYFVRRVLPREDSADCLSETLIVLWKQRWTLPADTEERRAWAFGVAKNVLANHRRSSIRREALSLRLRHHLTSTAPPPEHDDVTHALSALTGKDRELIQLIIWDGFGIAEAGALLGMKPGAARTRYFRIRTKLRHQLGSALPADRRND